MAMFFEIVRNIIRYLSSIHSKKNTELKSIYLYRGYFREAKAIVKNGYLEITFHSNKIAEKWDAAEEEVHEVAWLFRDFTRAWKPVHTDYSYMRVYQKI